MGAIIIWHSMGVVIGAIIMWCWCRFVKTAGVLKIDSLNPEKDVYRIEIDDLDSLHFKKRIVLKVRNNVDLSQE